MKKLLLTLTVLLASIAANAQKFALVDMEYILKNVPAYERANEQLNQVSKKWEGEVEALLNEAETLYKKYQSESVFLSDAQKTKAEEAIMAKEKEASDGKQHHQWELKFEELDDDCPPRLEDIDCQAVV